MFKYIDSIDLTNYGLYLNKTSVEVDTVNANISLEFSLPSGTLDGKKATKNLERFFLDLKLINELRGNGSVAVKEHYEELLTLMALTKNGETL